MSAALEDQVKGAAGGQLSPGSKAHIGVQGASTGLPLGQSLGSMAQNSNPHGMATYMNKSFANSASATVVASTYPPPKQPVFNQSYQLQHHSIPATQSLPATPPTSASTALADDKPQRNGTSEARDAKPEVVKDKENQRRENSAEKVVVQPAEIPQVSPASLSPSSTTGPAPPPAIAIQSATTPEKNNVKDVPAARVAERAKSSEKTEYGTPKSTPDASKSGEGALSAKTTPEKQSPAKITKTEESKESKDTKSVSLPLIEVSDAEITNCESPAKAIVLSKPKEAVTPTKSAVKVATAPRTPQRKSRTPKSDAESPHTVQKTAAPEPKPSTSKSPNSGKTKRSRVRTQPYQSPLPELEIISKISQNSTAPKSNESKLIVFYKQEFLAVRNTEGSFFVCQAVQNVYKSSARIKIRWLSQDKSEKSGEIYTPDFYDTIDFECILTNLELSKVEKGKFRLPPKEKERTDSILKRAIAVEKGEAISLDDSMTEDNPDGLDVSLYKVEDQLMKRRGSKRKLSKGRPSTSSSSKSPSPSGKDAKAAKRSQRRAAARKATTPNSESRMNTSGGRAERAKRRSAPEGTKTSPVIDNKKAKMLAKVVKRSASAVHSTKTSSAMTKAPKTRDMKASKQPVASTSKAKTPKVAASTVRKTPKRGRK